MTVNRIAAWASTAVVTVAVVFGLWLSGSPEKLRLERLDGLRTAELRQLTRAVNEYWETHGELPETVADAVDGLRLSRVPVDPVTGVPYRYEALTSQRYELCAEFSLSSGPKDEDNFWSHGAGRQCYAFAVEP
jgi:hypothetical protein